MPVRIIPGINKKGGKMELRRLRYFVAVAETENFRQAAELLCMAQPGLSRQIRLLEDELGVSLFDRLPRGVRLSDTGRLFLADAKRMIADVDRTIDWIRCFSTEGGKGVLKIALSGSLAGHRVVTESIRAFRSEQPNVELSLQLVKSAGRQYEAILKGEADIAFTYRRSDVSPKIVGRELDQLTLMAALPTSHPLATRTSLRLRELSNTPLICVARSNSPHPYDKLIKAFHAYDLIPWIVQEADSMIVLDLVLAGMGVGIVSSAMQSRLPQGITVLPIDDLTESASFDLIWRDDNLSAHASHLVDTILSVAHNPAKTVSTDAGIRL